MPPTEAPQPRRATRWRLLLVCLAIILLGLAAAVVATLRVEPRRASYWISQGPSCGEVDLPYPYSPSQQPATHDNRAAETCFAQAYARCHAASLTAFEVTGIDTRTEQTFVVEPPVLAPCGLADRSTDTIDVMQHTTTATCAGLTLQTDGLLVRGCGSLGDILLPAES